MSLYRIQPKLTAAAIMLSAAIFVSPTQARNGPLPHGIGTQFSLGGAGTALAIDSSNADANPAVLSRVDTQITTFFINFFQKQSVDTSMTPLGGPFRNPIGLQTNRFNNSPGGSLSGNYVVNEKWAVGLASSGGGANIKYRSPVFNPAVLTPTNSNYDNQLVNNIVLLSPTVSYRHTPCSSYGLSIILGNQTMKNNLPRVNLTQTSGALRKDSANGVGMRIGGLWDLNRMVSLGASASTPVKFGKFKKYLDVLPYSLDVPAMFRIGLALHAGNTDYLFDIKEAFFSKVKAAGNSLGWRNQTILMFGVQHRFTPCLILSAGYNHGNSLARKNNVLLNSLLMPIARQHFTAGARYHLTHNLEMSAGIEFSPNIQMVDDGTGILGSMARGARIKNREVGALLGITYHFGK
jgi:long-subunit fatty acid transport protein